MSVFKCKMCGGNLRADEQAAIGTCDHCGSDMTLPRINDERISNLFNRANHYRKSSEFDKAMASYENILNEDDSIAEAHWGIVLCKYGVEYVIDPITSEMIPTCHRTEFASILTDQDYISAINLADSTARLLYKKDAHQIERIQRKAIEITEKEVPYDIFICYKESDESGNRTEDSELAHDIYTYLLKEGFKTFYARITLRSHAGEEYEPYIFAALNSAKVMIVVGTKTDYLNSVWVKNEWSRFLALMKNKKEKIILPCYKGLNPYDLPDEFSHLQAYDMAVNTFMLDLTNIIRKTVHNKPESQNDNNMQSNIAATLTNETASALIKRADIFLSNNDFENAIIYYERCLDTNPECSLAYWGKLTAKLKCLTDDDIIELGQPIFDFIEYSNALRFASDDEKAKYLRVTEGIQTKIDNTISALQNCELHEVRKTGIERELSESELYFNTTDEFLRVKIEELAIIEQYLTSIAEQCKSLIQDETSIIAQTIQEAKDKLNQNKSRVSSSEKEHIINWIDNSRQLVAKQYDNLLNASEELSEYSEYHKLRSQQSELLTAIENAVLETQEISNSLLETCTKVNKIKSVYAEVYPEVKIGLYTKSKSLLSNGSTVL